MLKDQKKKKVLGLVATAIIPKSVYLNGKMATGLYLLGAIKAVLWLYSGSVKAILQGSVKAMSRLCQGYVKALLRLC